MNLSEGISAMTRAIADVETHVSATWVSEDKLSLLFIMCVFSTVVHWNNVAKMGASSSPVQILCFEKIQRKASKYRAQHSDKCFGVLKV